MNEKHKSDPVLSKLKFMDTNYANLATTKERLLM